MREKTYPKPLAPKRKKKMKVSGEDLLSFVMDEREGEKA